MAQSIHDEHMMLQGIPNDIEVMSEFMELPKAAQVVKKKDDGTFGVRFTHEGKTLGIEWYEGKSESWAEDAAENWILGIKDIDPTED